MNDGQIKYKRQQIADRESHIREMPQMSDAAKRLEYNLCFFFPDGIVSVKGKQGTGIIVMRDKAGRNFKLELTQISGPE